MPYVYRYIDMNKDEVVYVGKVTKEKQDEYDPLKNRHLQHKREEWYKEIGFKDLCMQYIEVASPVDADIYESFLISYYNTDQLVNKAKTGWGNSRLKIDIINPKRWMLYDNIEYGFEDRLSASLYALEICRRIRGILFQDECLHGEIERLMNEISRTQEYERKAQYIESSVMHNEDFRRKEMESQWGYDFRHPFEWLDRRIQAAVS